MAKTLWKGQKEMLYYIPQGPRHLCVTQNRAAAFKGWPSLWPCDMCFKYSLFKEGHLFQDVPWNFDKCSENHLWGIFPSHNQVGCKAQFYALSITHRPYHTHNLPRQRCYYTQRAKGCPRLDTHNSHWLCVLPTYFNGTCQRHKFSSVQSLPQRAQPNRETRLCV